MKLKVVVVDLEMEPAVKRWIGRIGAAAAVLFGGGAVAYASGLVTWSPGQTLQATDLNNNFNYVQGEITALQGLTHPLSGFRATMTNSTSIPTQSGTTPLVAVFNNLQFDLASEYSTTTGTFTAKNAGVYLAKCGVWWGNPPPGIYNIDIYRNGTSSYVTNEMDAVDNVTTTMVSTSNEVTATYQLNAGDTLNCMVWQNSGSTAGFGGSGAGSRSDRDNFSVVRLE